MRRWRSGFGVGVGLFVVGVECGVVCVWKFDQDTFLVSWGRQACITYRGCGNPLATPFSPRRGPRCTS